MNKLVKIGPIIVILAAGGSLFFVFKLDQMKKANLAQIADVSSNLSNTKGTLQKTESTLGTARKALSATSNELAEANTNLQTTKASLDAKTQEADGLKTQVAERDQQLQARTTELANVKDTLQKIQDGLKEVGVDVTNVGQIRQKIQNMAAETQVLTDQLAKKTAENSALLAENVDLKTTPTNTRGRVADVQERWGFLVLDIGEQQHVRKNSEFLVYRDNKPVGRVQVLYVGENVSVAEILPGQRVVPRIGDTAVH